MFPKFKMCDLSFCKFCSRVETSSLPCVTSCSFHASKVALADSVGFLRPNDLSKVFRCFKVLSYSLLVLTNLGDKDVENSSINRLRVVGSPFIKSRSSGENMTVLIKPRISLGLVSVAPFKITLFTPG